METPVKKGFLAKILENNREFDSTVAVMFVFSITVGTIASIVIAMMLGKQVPDKMFEIVNVFENFILMILSRIFSQEPQRGTAGVRRNERADDREIRDGNERVE